MLTIKYCYSLKVKIFGPSQNFWLVTLLRAPSADSLKAYSKPRAFYPRFAQMRVLYVATDDVFSVTTLLSI